MCLLIQIKADSNDVIGKLRSKIIKRLSYKIKERREEREISDSRNSKKKLCVAFFNQNETVKNRIEFISRKRERERASL